MDEETEAFCLSRMPSSHAPDQNGTPVPAHFPLWLLPSYKFNLVDLTNSPKWIWPLCLASSSEPPGKGERRAYLMGGKVRMQGDLEACGYWGEALESK